MTGRCIATRCARPARAPRSTALPMSFAAARFATISSPFVFCGPMRSACLALSQNFRPKSDCRNFMSEVNAVKRGFEAALFASRWLMAPFYLGLVIALMALLATFARELVGRLPGLLHASEADVILWLLALIDLSLVGNLLI